MSTAATYPDQTAEIRSMAWPLSDEPDLQPLVDRIGDAHYVLLGEASHGTTEYYRWRAAITRRLIAEHGFSFVAVEGDWPDCFELNRWAKDRCNQDLTAEQTLIRFQSWPTWMWANTDVAEFLGWLRAHNQRHQSNVGFYGLDVYSLWESLHAVLAYLRRARPDALPAAYDALRCFEPYGRDPQDHAWATQLVPSSCEDEVVDLLVALKAGTTQVDGDPEAELDAQQNAEVLASADRYYRTMLQSDSESWNIRDHHMADTLDRLMQHHGPGARGIVWAHNTHIGDARATDMATAGMVNVGELTRERHAQEGVVLVGMGCHHGMVTAADFWGAPMRQMTVPPAPRGSHEDLLHQHLGAVPSLLVFPDDRTSPWLANERGHRAIGVVYRPGTDARTNWVPTIMGRRYDAFLSFEATEALTPLHPRHPRQKRNKRPTPGRSDQLSSGRGDGVGPPPKCAPKPR